MTDGVLLGAAVVSSLTWSYAWTPAAGDVGSRSLTAIATDTGSPATGSATGPTLTVQAAIDKSQFTGGLYVPSVSGAQGSSLGTLTSTSPATMSLTPSATAPKVYTDGVRGNPAAFFQNSGSPYQYFTCDTIAPSLRSGTANWVIAIDQREDKPSDMPVFSALKSSGDAAEQLFFHLSIDRWKLVKKTPTGGTQTLTGPALLDPYSDSMLAVKCTAGVITLHERAAGQTTETITALGTLEPTAFSSAIDRVAFGCSVSSVPFEVSSCYQKSWAFAAVALSDADIHKLFDEWAFDSYVSNATGVGAVEPGDSIMTATQDVYTSAGHRNIMAEFWGQNQLGIFVHGDTESGGTGRQGTGRNLRTSALSGQTIEAIGAQVLNDIANSIWPAAFWYCYMGGGNNNAHESTASIVAKYKTHFAAGMNALIAKTGADAHAFVSPLIPLSDSLTQAGIDAFYAAWFASGGLLEWHRTNYPGRIYAGNWNLALGGAYGAQYFGVDLAHPNRAGSVQMALDPVNGTIWAKNELGETLGTRWRRTSKTVARPPTLTGAVTSPAPASSIANGVAQTFLIDCSRIGTKPTFKVDGVAKGTCVPGDIYDYVVNLGAYVKTPHIQWSYVWTPAVGDVGVRSITVDFLDCDQVTTGTSAALAITVT